MSRNVNVDFERFFSEALKRLTSTQLGLLLKSIHQKELGYFYSHAIATPLILHRMVDSMRQRSDRGNRICPTALQDLIICLSEHRASSELWHPILMLITAKGSPQLCDQIQDTIRAIPKTSLFLGLISLQLQSYKSFQRATRIAGSWKMFNAQISCKFTEAFLRGPSMSTIIRGQFNSIIQARNFKLRAKGFLLTMCQVGLVNQRRCRCR